jgi:subtilisin family serine protease
MADQKIENQLNLALQTPESEREKSLGLSIGYDAEDNIWELIIRYYGSLDIVREELNIEIVELLSNYAVLYIPENLIDRLVSYPQIEYIEKPKALYFATIQGRTASCVNPVQYNITNGLFGAGVIIGVIDSGIDYAHQDFRNVDGTTRILSIWDQSINGEPPEGFVIGTEYSKEDIDRALRQTTTEGRIGVVPSMDNNGHGTHVTSIAAGNGRGSGGRTLGVAPMSDIMVVKAGPVSERGFIKTTQIMMGLSYLIQKAIEYGRPIAINLSFGNNYGSHEGRALLETFIDDISGLWKNVIVVGTGNEGSAGKHTDGFVTDQPVTVEFAISANESNVNLQIWKSYADLMQIYIISPSGIETVVLSNALTRQVINFGTQTKVLIFYGEPAPYNRAQEIYFEFLPLLGTYIESGIWKIRLEPVDVINGEFDMWLPTSEAVGRETRFLNPTFETTLTIPSTASRAISVGAYNSLLNSIADFSGRGFTRAENIVKPDIVAPGVNIVAAAPGGGYSTRSGTSMATPFVTGSSAILMEWGIVRGNDDYLYGEKIKAYLIAGARRNPQTVYPNINQGYGMLCLEESLRRAAI